MFAINHRRSRNICYVNFGATKSNIWQQHVSEVIFSPGYCQGHPKSEKFICQQKPWYLKNDSDGKSFHWRTSYCVVVLCLIRPTRDKKIGFPKSKMVELHIVEFLLTYQACQYNARVGDRQTAHFGEWLLLEVCTDCTRWLAFHGAWDEQTPKVRL